MVKNKTGGSRHKKQARKHVMQQPVRIKTRLKNATEPCEQYAIITKLFGQGQCESLCNDGVIRHCIIRSKFRGRNKRHNRVEIGTRVLVGLRDWEVLQKDKKSKCDLLEVYDKKQLSDLKKDVNFNSKLLKTEMEMSKNSSTAAFTFVSREDDEGICESGSGDGEGDDTTNTDTFNDFDINIDDI